MTAEPYYRRLIQPDCQPLLAVLGGAAFVLVAAAFAQGGPFPALAVLLPMAAGAGLRYRGMPVVAVLIVMWLQVFPLGLPTFFESAAALRGTGFRLTDLLTAVALVVYLSSQYRLYTMTDRAVPTEHPAKGRPISDRPMRPGPVSDAELFGLVAVAGLMAVGGQVVWFLLTDLELRYDAMPPIRFRRAGVDNDLISRLGLLLGGAAAVVLGARLVFGLWRQSRYTADEGKLLLLDIGWQEVRREAARQETWRQWPFRKRSRARPGSFVGRLFLAMLVIVLAVLGFGFGLIALRQMNL